MQSNIDAPVKGPKRKLTPAELAALETRTQVPQTVSTVEAAALLFKTPQCLRRWACAGSGPITPVRVGASLRWKVSDIQALLNGGAP